jgi:hypothetical protein
MNALQPYANTRGIDLWEKYHFRFSRGIPPWQRRDLDTDQDLSAQGSASGGDPHERAARICGQIDFVRGL